MIFTVVDVVVVASFLGSTERSSTNSWRLQQTIFFAVVVVVAWNAESPQKLFKRFSPPFIAIFPSSPTGNWLLGTNSTARFAHS